MERHIDVFFLFFIGFGYVGTDGARTRSFRLDRAVLWPIELQSRRKKMYSIHVLIILFKPFLFSYFLFRLKVPCCNRDVGDIHTNIHFSESCTHCLLLVTLSFRYCQTAVESPFWNENKEYFCLSILFLFIRLPYLIILIWI